MTAVEWLTEELRNQFGIAFSDNILEKAKEMEKQQIVDAYSDGGIHVIFNKMIGSEQYYNKTYKKA